MAPTNTKNMGASTDETAATVPLATFDGGLLKAFPAIAARPGSLLRK